MPRYHATYVDGSRDHFDAADDDAARVHVAGKGAPVLTLDVTTSEQGHRKSVWAVDEGFRFDRDYDNVEQVRPFMPAFLAVLTELESAGQYRYNDSFRGRIPGIQGPSEDTAIYLLQGLEREDKQAAKVSALLADGYSYVEHLDAPTKHAHIVLVPTGRMSGEWSEHRDSRLVPRPGGGAPHAIIPKGKRTHGHLVSSRRVLVSPGKKS